MAEQGSLQHPSITSRRSPETVQDGTGLNEKPRLTEQEKKNNHIVSEQKRRLAIREGFDELAKIVPGLEGQGRSEAIVLQGAVAYMKQLLAERHQLLQKADEAGLPASSSKTMEGVQKYMLDTQTMRIAATCDTSELDTGMNT